jgi:hypothetical protein
MARSASPEAIRRAGGFGSDPERPGWAVHGRKHYQRVVEGPPNAHTVGQTWHDRNLTNRDRLDWLLSSKA